MGEREGDKERENGEKGEKGRKRRKRKTEVKSGGRGRGG